MRLTMPKQTLSSSLLSRTAAALAVAAVILLCGSSAFALDNYSDRKGLFSGLGFGGGVGAVNLADSDATSGFEGGRQPGLQFTAMVGGGVNKNIVLGAQGNGWFRTVHKGSRSWEHSHYNLLADANFFLIEGLYAEVGAGLAYAAYDSYDGGDDPSTYREMGFAAKAGVGFEYFLNGTHAAGINAGYTRHFYANADFDTISAAITWRWY